MVCISVDFQPPGMVRIEYGTLVGRINCITYQNHIHGSYTPATQSKASPRIQAVLYKICVIGLYIEIILKSTFDACGI